MNREVTRIAGQLRGSFDSGAWYGPSLRELLAGLAPECAGKRAGPDAHSIWELTLHIAAWENAARRMLGGGAGDVPPEKNFPPLPELADSAWKSALEELAEAHTALLEAVGRLSDDDLDELAAGRDFSKYSLLHGVVQHNVYHAGQIAILKKLLL